MTSWAHYRRSNGSLRVFSGVVEALGSVEDGYFFAAVADLTARAQGPFVSYIQGGQPLWSDVFPAGRRTITRLTQWVFDDKPDRIETQIDRIRHHAYRDGSRGQVYHFYHPEILDAYTKLAFPDLSAESAIGAGKFWWTGPVEALKTDLLEKLRAAGLLGRYGDQRIYECFDLILAEQLREVKAGHVQNLPDMTANLKAYISRRYQAKELSGSKYDWLRYDAFWSLLNRLTGITELRPSVKSNEKVAYKLLFEVSALLKKLDAAGVDDETYLRAYMADARFRRAKPVLETILHPPEHLFLS